MFFAIEGEVICTLQNCLSLKTSSGISFLIFVSNVDKFKVNDKVNLHIFDVFKDEEFKLYGFKSQKELEIFKNLIEINGIGPKTALQILKNVEVNYFITLIKENKIDSLKRISGIGNKAERIVYELKGKIPDVENYSPDYLEIYDVLLKLGYKSEDIHLVLDKLEDLTDKSKIIIDAVNRLKNE